MTLMWRFIFFYLFIYLFFFAVDDASRRRLYEWEIVKWRIPFHANRLYLFQSPWGSKSSKANNVEKCKQKVEKPSPEKLAKDFWLFSRWDC